MSAMSKPIDAGLQRRGLMLAGLGLAVGVGAAPQTIRIAAIRASVEAPVLVLEKYLPSGWKTDISYFTSPSDMSNALLTGDVDLAYTGLTVGVVARSKDQPIVIVANLAGKGTAIVAATGVPIHAIADLKGKRVGYLPLSIHDILLREELRKVDLRPSDLTLIRLAPADMPPALQRGDIEAFSGNEPNATIAVLGGYGRVLSYPYDNPVGTINVGVLSSERVVHEKPQMLALWATAHAASADALMKDPDGWSALVVKNWGYGAQATRQSLGNIELAWRIDAAFKTQLAAFTDRLQQLGVIGRAPNPAKLLATQFVDGVHS
jgi:NitT/TauT family transport system substrate-binding protein